MKFLGLEKRLAGRFVTRFDLRYRTESGREKVYEMISRDGNITGLENGIRNGKCDAVILIITSVDGNKILLNKEFRMAVGDFAYNFPAGLIDPGESLEEAARRELWEETGLKLEKIEEVLPVSYSAVGITNEKSCCVIGTASGEFAPSTSDEEEIEAAWYDKEQVRELLKGSSFAARTQAYCWWWAKQD